MGGAVRPGSRRVDGIKDEITKQMEVALYYELIVAEASRVPEHLDALDYVLRGRAAQFKPIDRDNYAEAIGLLERALALDPHSADAQGWLADKLVGRALDEMTDTAAADISRAAELAAQALAGSSRSAFAHSAQGQALRAQGRYKEAIAEYETASAINPGWPHLYGFLSSCKLWTGSIADTIPLVEQAIQISPRDPHVADWYSQIGRVHLLLSRTNDAIVWLERARSVNPQFPIVHAMLASAYALNGEIERAAAELAEARRLNLDGRYYSLARLRAAHRDYLGVPRICALFEATHFAGLLKAGMPDH